MLPNLSGVGVGAQLQTSRALQPQLQEIDGLRTSSTPALSPSPAAEERPRAPGMTLEGQPIRQGAAPSKMHAPPQGSLGSVQGRNQCTSLWTMGSQHHPSLCASSGIEDTAASCVLLCTNENKGCRPSLTCQTPNIIAMCKPPPPEL